MLRKVKTVISVVLAICMMSTAVFASQAISSDNLVSKNAYVLDEQANSYKVQLSVPGVDGDDLHDEIILMVDGSYSGDKEWPLMKDAIISIGETVLNGSGNTQLTLMAFGMGDNEVLTHVTSAEDLSAAVGVLPGNLLYGRSSTNCEAGFTGVAEYIENHDETLNTAHVLFISDGGINTDETPYDFYNWKENTWLRWSVDTIIESNFAAECDAINEGANRSEAFISVFGKDSDVEEVAANATTEQLYQWSDKLWADVYAYSNLTAGTEYPVSEVERAFVKYDKEHNTYLQDNFYYALVGRSYPNKATRTPAAAAALASMEKVSSMYIIDNNATTAWMKNIEGTEFIPAGSIAGIIDALEGTLTNLSKTPFNDVVVTDYMSKWVNLDVSTISIVNNKTGEVIYRYSDGWLVPAESRPTQDEMPVKVELVPQSDYSAGGTDVEGNTSGDIYKLTWKVKDGAMLRADSYHLEYTVYADVKENGFEFGKAYPANGNTTVYYTDVDGLAKSNEIDVPEISALEVVAPNKDSEEIVFSNAKYAYIFGHAPLITTNPDGTQNVAIRMGMEEAVTVEQVCAMLSRAIDQEFANTPNSYAATNKTAGFANAWYYRGISYLDSLGAFDNGERVIGSATRGQVAQLIALGLKLESSDIELEFADTKGHKAESYIKSVVARGYMQGMGNGKFEPDKIMTRAEFCSLFNNILGKTGNMLIAKDENGNTYEVTAEKYYFVDMSPSHWAYDDCLIATSAYFEDGYVDMKTRLDNIRNKIDRYDAQKEY